MVRGLDFPCADFLVSHCFSPACVPFYEFGKFLGGQIIATQDDLYFTLELSQPFEHAIDIAGAAMAWISWCGTVGLIRRAGLASGVGKISK